MSKTKLWDVSVLTFKIYFSNPLILHVTEKGSQNELSELFKAIQLTHGTERMRSWVSWWLALWFFHCIILRCPAASCTISHSTTKHCTVPHHTTLILYSIQKTALCCYTLQYSTNLYYYFLLYHAFLQCTLLHHSTPRCTPLSLVSNKKQEMNPNL